MASAQSRSTRDVEPNPFAGPMPVPPPLYNENEDNAASSLRNRGLDSVNKSSRVRLIAVVILSALAAMMAFSHKSEASKRVVMDAVGPQPDIGSTDTQPLPPVPVGTDAPVVGSTGVPAVAPPSSKEAVTPWWGLLPTLRSCPFGPQTTDGAGGNAAKNKASCTLAFSVNTTIVNGCSYKKGKGTRCVSVFSAIGLGQQAAEGATRTQRRLNLIPKPQPSSSTELPQYGVVTLNTTTRATSESLTEKGSFAIDHSDWSLPTKLVATTREVPFETTGHFDVLPKPTRYFSGGIMLPEPTCFGNMWHGFAENVIPIFDALVRSGYISQIHNLVPFRDPKNFVVPAGGYDVDLYLSTLDQKTTADGRWAERFAVIFSMPQRDLWAMWNHGCQSRQKWPYGLRSNIWASRMLLHALNVDLDRPDVAAADDGEQRKLDAYGAPLADAIFFLGEQDTSPHSGPINPFPGTVRIVDRLVMGSPSTCRQFMGGGAPGNAGAPEWPYFSPDVHLYGEGKYCRQLHIALRRLVLEREGIIAPAPRPGKPSSTSSRAASDPPTGVDQPIWDDAPLSAQERKCPHILFIQRPVNGSARVIQNFGAVKAAIVKECVKRCPEGGWVLRPIYLERISVAEQLRLVHNHSLIIAARGAGTTQVLFQRQGAGYLSLNVADNAVPVTKDQWPWYPYVTFLPKRHVVISNCAAITSGAGVKRECTDISRNYCDMDCGVTGSVAAFGRLLDRMSGGLSDGDADPESYDNLVPPIVRRDGTDYYAS